MILAASGGVFRRRANGWFSCSPLIILAWLHPTGMVDAATLQARLDAELQEHRAAGRAIYDGDRRLAAGVIKGPPDDLAIGRPGRLSKLRSSAAAHPRAARTARPRPLA